MRAQEQRAQLCRTRTPRAHERRNDTKRQSDRAWNIDAPDPRVQTYDANGGGLRYAKRPQQVHRG
jgi:hypothetical protein